jgi:hypothetical protein
MGKRRFRMARLWTRMPGLVFLAHILVLPASRAHAASSAGIPLTLLQTLLQPDGRLNLNTGFSGSLDVIGYKAVSID